MNENGPEEELSESTTELFVKVNQSNCNLFLELLLTRFSRATHYLGLSDFGRYPEFLYVRSKEAKI